MDEIPMTITKSDETLTFLGSTSILFEGEQRKLAYSNGIDSLTHVPFEEDVNHTFQMNKPDNVIFGRTFDNDPYKLYLKSITGIFTLKFYLKNPISLQKLFKESKQ